MLKKVMEEEGRHSETRAGSHGPDSPAVSQGAQTVLHTSREAPVPSGALGSSLYFSHRGSSSEVLEVASSLPTRSVLSPFFLAPEPAHAQEYCMYMHAHMYACVQSCVCTC